MESAFSREEDAVGAAIAPATVAHNVLLKKRAIHTFSQFPVELTFRPFNQLITPIISKATITAVDMLSLLLFLWVRDGDHASDFLRIPIHTETIDCQTFASNRPNLTSHFTTHVHTCACQTPHAFRICLLFERSAGQSPTSIWSLSVLPIISTRKPRDIPVSGDLNFLHKSVRTRCHTVETCDAGEPMQPSTTTSQPR